MKERRNNMLGIKRVWSDIKNYREWIKTIKAEEANPDSLYSKYKMDKNIFYNIYVIVTLPDEDKILPEKIQRLRLIESLAPLNRYLDSQLKFAEYLTPEFSRVYDNDEPTLNYLVVYRFTFQKLSLKWILSRLIFAGIITWSAFNIPFEKIIQWISSLI